LSTALNSSTEEFFYTVIQHIIENKLTITINITIICLSYGEEGGNDGFWPAESGRAQTGIQVVDQQK